MTEIRCPSCGAMVAAGSTCQSCGLPLQEIAHKPAPSLQEQPITEMNDASSIPLSGAPKGALWAIPLLLVGVLLYRALAGGGGSLPRPAPVRTHTPRPTATRTHTPRPTATRTPENTASPTRTNTLRPVVKHTPEPTASSTRTHTHTLRPTSTQTHTLRPTATRTHTPRPTATRAPDAQVSHSSLNLHAGPGNEYAVVRNYAQGTAVSLTGKSTDGQWVQVRTPDGLTGWMWAAYLRIDVSLASVPVIQTSSAASCRYKVDPTFSSAQTDGLGCPLAEAKVVWSAIQAFEGGYLLWRSDVNRATVFYNSGRQETLSDQWHGESYSIGAPPGGRVAPERGFGWLWATKPEIRDGLGWGLEPEKGFCVRIQYFGSGFALRSVTGSCGNEFNRANEGDFAPIFLVAEDSGGWNKNTVQLPVVAASSTPPPRPSTAPTVVVVLLDGFDSYPGQDALQSAYHINAAWGQNQASLSLVPAQTAGSAPNCLMFEYDIRLPAPDDYAGFERDMAPQDWRGRDSLSFWVRSDQSRGYLVVQFREESGEVWRHYRELLEISPSGVRVRLELDERVFAWADWSIGDNQRIDLERINYFGFFVDGAAGSGRVYLDDVYLN